MTDSNAGILVNSTGAMIRGVFSPRKRFKVNRLDPVLFIPLSSRRRFLGTTENGNAVLADNNGDATGETCPLDCIAYYG